MKTTHPEYNDEQQHLARYLAGKLRETTDGLRETMSDHAIATAMLGVGVEHAARYMGPAEVAEWLRGVADELDGNPDMDCAGHA